MTLVLNILLAILMGFAVAYLTGLFLNVKKAKKYPGGSMLAGTCVGLLVGYGFGLIVICGIAGIIGWVIYSLIFKK